MKFLICLFILLVPATANATCGIASYYGGRDGLCGHKTATGERLNCNGHTAAHRTIPFGTVLHVTHKGRSLDVRVNDRGPFIRGRILDLSLGAARALGMGGTGHVCF